MGTITKRQLKDGSFSYRAQVRARRPGFPVFNQSRTFSKKSLADEWVKRTEAEIERNPEKMLNPDAQLNHKSLKDFIHQYLEEADSFARTKSGALNFIARQSIAEKDAYSLTRQDFAEYIISRRKGDPLQAIDGVSPSTALKDMSHIKAVLVHAEFVWGEPLEGVLLEHEKALTGLQKSRIVTKSKLRTRLPTAEELQLLTNYFYKSWRRVKSSAPMHLIMWFAIYTARRENEICNLLLSDYDEINAQWLVRDAKNPKGSLGNHKYAHFEPRAVAMISEFMKPEVRDRMYSLGGNKDLLIPVKGATVSSYFTRACKAANIEDLRFHDLRHEAATRYAEDGLTIPQLQTITLHESWNTLKRYVNLKKRGVRLEFEDALRIAEDSYNDYYKEWSKTQRYIALNDRDEAFEEESEIITPFVFVKKYIDLFIEIHKDNKYFKRIHSKKLNSKNPFAWNNKENRFYAHDIQLSWEDWFVSSVQADWSELPSDATHFNVRDLSVVKRMTVRIYVYDMDLKVWVDSFGDYHLDGDKHITKNIK